MIEVFPHPVNKDTFHNLIFTIDKKCNRAISKFYAKSGFSL